jgi:hypothetical protein
MLGVGAPFASRSGVSGEATVAVAIALGLCACVGALVFYLDVMTKRCWNCRRRLKRSAMLCPYCGKWWQSDKTAQQGPTASARIR